MNARLAVAPASAPGPASPALGPPAAEVSEVLNGRKKPRKKLEAAPDNDLAQCKALVVDSNQLSRSILAAQLRDLGVGTVVQCSQTQDARRHLEARSFDVVLCEHSFENGSSGQDLLDDLRRNNLLPYSTVFFMVTGEATYAKVAEAAESALDSYLLKPYTGSALAQRLEQARHRKRVFKQIFDALEDGQFDVAAKLCLQRFASRGEYWLFAARIGAELLLRIGMHDQARMLYEAVLQAKTLPWAKLGIARAQVDAGEPTQALRTLDALIQSDPGYGDAYDVMGRVQLEQGHIGEALETYSKAAELTPGSISRAQKQGTLAFYAGETALCTRALERAVSLGLKSKMFDPQTLVLLAFCRYRVKDDAGLRRCSDDLARIQERQGRSARLQRFALLVDLLRLMNARQVAIVVSSLREVLAQVREPDFDVEAACNVVSLLSEFAADELRLDFVEDCIDMLAMRFVTTKCVGELVARAAHAHTPYQEIARRAHVRVTELAEEAMSFSLAGDPFTAVKTLLAHGQRTLNAKLIDVAAMVLQRHQARVREATELQAQVSAFRQRFGAAAQVPRLGDEAGRKAGGLTLRAARPLETPASTVPPQEPLTDASALSEASPDGDDARPSS